MQICDIPGEALNGGALNGSVRGITDPLKRPISGFLKCSRSMKETANTIQMRVSAVPKSI